MSKTVGVIGQAAVGATLIGVGLATGNPMLIMGGGSLLLGAAAQALSPTPQLGTAGGRASAQVGLQGPVPAERMVFGLAGIQGTPAWFKYSADQIHGKPDREYAIIPYLLTRRRALTDLLAVWVQGHRIPLVPHTGWISYFPPFGLVADPADKYHGNMWIHWEPGDGSAGFFQFLSDRSDGGWDQTHTLTDISYAGVAMVFDPDLWPQPQLDLTFEVKGHALWDPRTGAEVYSANPALAWLHALTGVHGPRGGIGLDLVDLDSVIAAANVCDERLTVKDGGVVKRYEIHGVFDSTEDFENVEQQILACMAGTRVKSGARYSVYAGAARPVVADLTTDDLAGTYTISPKRDREGLYNSSKALFVKPDKGFVDGETPAYPPAAGQGFTVLEARNASGVSLLVVNAAGVPIGVHGPTFNLLGNPYQFQDGGQVLVHELQLRGVTSGEQAQRLVKIDLEQHRRQATWSAPFKPLALLRKPMDVVTFTDRALGWDHKQFLVAGWTRTRIDDALAVTLDFAEYDATVYAWSASEEQDEAGTGSPVNPDLSATAPILLDAPALTLAATRDWGFYAGYVATDASKPTAPVRLYRSPAADQEPDPVLYLPRPLTAGTCSSVLPGGDVGYIDPGAALTVVLFPAGAFLTPATDFDVANLLNLAWVGPASGKGGEVLQFGTAVNTSGRTWRLGRLRRGLFGTEDRIAAHGSGEIFVLMDDRLGRVPDSPADLDKPLLYWTAYEARLPDWQDVPGAPFTNNGESRRPLPPTHVRLFRNAAGDLLATWEPRTRGFIGMTGAPQLIEPRWEFRLTVYRSGRAAAGYPVSVYDQPFAWTYTAAQQRADLGAAAATLDLGIRQRSDGFGVGDENRSVLRVSGTF